MPKPAIEITPELLARITDDTPLRLDVAALVAFPDGGMTGATLRREAWKGRLAVERIAGKLFTTLNDIRAMREAARAKAPKQIYKPDPPPLTKEDIAEAFDSAQRNIERMREKYRQEARAKAEANAAQRRRDREARLQAEAAKKAEEKARARGARR